MKLTYPPTVSQPRIIGATMLGIFLSVSVCCADTAPAAAGTSAGSAPTVQAPIDLSPVEAETERLLKEVAAKGVSADISAYDTPIDSQIERPVPTSHIRPSGPVRQAITYFVPYEPLGAGTTGYRESQYFGVTRLPDGETVYKNAMSDQKITLKEAIEITEANSLRLRSMHKKVEVAQAKLTEARRALFPTVQGILEMNGGIAGRFYKGRNWKVNITQPVYYGGELILTVKQAEANARQAEIEYKKAQAEIIGQARLAYYGVVKAEYNLQYQKEVFRKVDGIRSTAVKQYARKIISEVDYLHIESQYQQVFFQNESSKHDLLSANLLFQQTLGVRPEQTLDVELKLDFVKITPDFDQVMRYALANNPDLLIKRSQLESARYGMQVYEAKKRPRVDMRGSYGYFAETFQDTQAHEEDKLPIDLEKEWFIGVTANMPLGPNSIEYSQIKHQYGPSTTSTRGSTDFSHKVTFGLFDRLSDITDGKSAESTYLNAKEEYENNVDTLTVNVRDAFYNISKNLLQIDSTIAKIRYQEKQNAVLKYLMGLQESSPSGYVDSLVELASDRFAFIQAISDYHLAVSNLNATMGDIYYFKSEP